MTRRSYHKVKAPDSAPPLNTRSRQNMMSTIASNTEKGSCESAGARLNDNRRIRKWLGRIDGPRAQGRRPPPVAGTRARAFNAPAIFSPNPIVTGSVIGSKHPSNLTFRNFVPQKSKNTARHSETVETSHHGPLEAPKVSAPINRALRGAGPSSKCVPSHRRVGR